MTRVITTAIDRAVFIGIIWLFTRVVFHSPANLTFGYLWWVLLGATVFGFIFEGLIALVKALK